MLAPLRSVNDRRFWWLRSFFLKSFQDWLNSVQQCKGNFTKDACQKMFKSWQTYEGLKISVNEIIEATQFLLWHQVKYVLTDCSCRDPLENWFGRHRSLGSRKDNQIWLTLDITIMLLETKNISNQPQMVMLLKCHDYHDWRATSMSET